MKTIKDLFDPARDIYRTIEKVITYDASRESGLKAEISEYVVTESIEEQFEKLLTRMQTAMEAGGENEVGVWVSGFYGSGKSSFTKYLGLAFDERVRIDGTPFLKHLQNRFHKPGAKALLSAVSKRYPAAVVMLDLSSEMLAGAAMEEVSAVLYYKALQWAGYSRNLKVAAFERKLKKEGRYEEFRELILETLEMEWEEVQNDPLVVDSMLPGIAHQMYPALFKTPDAFTTASGDYIRFEDERVREMLDIIRDASGKERILFIVDELGQYVGARQQLILNLQGLAQNLKNIGDGKVWLIGAAQQTLTEDDPRAALNAPELYRLKDRFPIRIDLESSDIREICYRRLLAKSPGGEALLGERFDKSGQKLRRNTRLREARYYDSDFNRETFINLYPFLPAHFDILLNLLGALAKTTGGVGLRSAIKVIQDILIEGCPERPPAAERPVGWLATTVTLYDALEKDIENAFRAVHQAVGNAKIRSGDLGDAGLDPERVESVAKTVAILQILGNIPVTVHNVGGLMHPGVDAPGSGDEVKRTVDAMLKDPHIPLGEQDGGLRFFSEKLNDIEKEKADIPIKSSEVALIRNEALKEVFTPRPSVRIHGSMAVSSGVKAQKDRYTTSLSGERSVIQTIVSLPAPGNYEAARARRVDESRGRDAQRIIYLLGRSSDEMAEKAGEIHRCREIRQRYRMDPDQEVKEYRTSQGDRAGRLFNELQKLLNRSLTKGSLVFQGQVSAVTDLAPKLPEACRKHLAEVAARVFDRHPEAPVRAKTTLAEQFLRADNLAAITTKIDPLGLVRVSGGVPSIRSDHKALLSIRDHIDRVGAVEGKGLIRHFTGAPFGWSQDTLRYLVAALLVAGEIKLRVSGREVTVNGQLAIDALKSNRAFKSVGVSPRDERLSMDVLARAAERLTELIGDIAAPLEDEISKLSAKHLPRFQTRYAPLGEKLAALELPGVERIHAINQEIADLLFTDASDAPRRLGGEVSALYENLKWAAEVDLSFQRDLEAQVRTPRGYLREIEALPDDGEPGRLRRAASEELDRLEEILGREDFYKHTPDLGAAVMEIEAMVRDAARAMAEERANAIEEARRELRAMPEWTELSKTEGADALAKLEPFRIDPSPDMAGVRELSRTDAAFYRTTNELPKSVKATGAQRREEREEERKRKARKDKIHTRRFSVPAVVTSLEELKDFQDQLKKLRSEIVQHDKVEIFFEVIYS